MPKVSELLKELSDRLVAGKEGDYEVEDRTEFRSTVDDELDAMQEEDEGDDDEDEPESEG